MCTTQPVYCPIRNKRLIVEMFIISIVYRKASTLKVNKSACLWSSWFAIERVCSVSVISFLYVVYLFFEYQHSVRTLFQINQRKLHNLWSGLKCKCWLYEMKCFFCSSKANFFVSPYHRPWYRVISISVDFYEKKPNFQ